MSRFASSKKRNRDKNAFVRRHDDDGETCLLIRRTSGRWIVLLLGGEEAGGGEGWGRSSRFACLAIAGSQLTSHLRGDKWGALSLHRENSDTYYHVYLGMFGIGGGDKEFVRLRYSKSHVDGRTF